MKYNKPSKGNSTSAVITTSESGVESYIPDKKSELLNMVGSWLVNEPKFYTTPDVETTKIVSLIKDMCRTNPEFIAKLAVYCREVLHLRTAPVVILVHMALESDTKKFVRRITPRICTRADQMTDVIAYLQSVIGNIGNLSSSGSMPCSLKRGLADTITKFSEEQLSRYDSNSTAKLRDVVILTHAKPKNKQQERLFERIITRDLEMATTWQTTTSTLGNNKEAWEQAMESMGVFAMIRNCGNFLKHGCDVSPVIKKLSDKDAVIKARIFPHQILTAYRKIQDNESVDTPKLLRVLEKAVEASLSILPIILGRTLLLADHSGSMDHNISTGRSDVESTVQLTRRDATNIALAIAIKRCKQFVTAVFSNGVKVVQLNQDGTIIQNAESLNGKIEYAGTDTPGAIDYFTKKNTEFDRIVILTDDEPTNSDRTITDAINEYRKTINPKTFLHTVNFVGYGTQSVNNTKLNNYISGFTERFLDLIPRFEMGAETQIKEVERITL